MLLYSSNGDDVMTVHDNVTLSLLCSSYLDEDVSTDKHERRRRQVEYHQSYRIDEDVWLDFNRLMTALLAKHWIKKKKKLCKAQDFKIFPV